MFLDWGVEVVLWLQRFSPTLDLPFLALSFLGDEKFLLPVVLGLYWCLDRRLGLRLGLVLLCSSHLNAVAKELAQQPRPYQYDARVMAIDTGSSGGLPSGHTQATTVFWGYAAIQCRRSWLRAVAVFLLIGIPLSRLYLGAHFPTDLLGGYILGAVLLLLLVGLAPRLEAWLGQRSRLWQWGLALGLPLILLLATGGHRHTTMSAAALLGISCGAVTERQWIGFTTHGLFWQRAMRLGVGLGGLVIILGLFHIAFGGIVQSVPGRILGFALAGFWVSGGAPWVFVTLRLAARQPYRGEPGAS